MRLELGKNLLGIEGEVAWATPGSFTVHNYPCYENGENCVEHQQYVDPSDDMVQIERRLLAASNSRPRTNNIRG